jgi:hypothetical protein
LDKKLLFWLRIILSMILGCAILLIVYLGSRAAILSMLVIAVFHLKYHTRVLSKRSLSRGLLFFLVVIALALLFYKYKSSGSRAFIWYNSLTLIRSNFFGGVGLGRFDAEYNAVQCDFFRTHAENNVFTDIAAHVDTGYNDFLELFVECGCVSAFALIVLIGTAITAMFRSKDHQVRPFLISLIAFVPIMLSWSTLKFLPFLLPFVVVLAVASYAVSNTKTVSFGSRANVALHIFVVGVSFCVVWQGLVLNKAYNRYKEAIKTGNNDFFYEAYQKLKFNGRFLFDYAVALKRAGDHEMAVSLLDEATTWSYAPRIFILKGEIFQLVDKNMQAAVNYEKAHYIAPSRLYPRYKLARLYFAIGNCKKGMELAQQIIGHTGILSEDELLLKEELRYYSKKNAQNLL